ncbi:hypothetical protein [Candidatus Lokiarchaeum ossiferum]|uniref:hypothetical protein n=1 Tax=Candidatus Lokiarchaeum ossiferum TaxID=2951803 RepID=UPI00352E8031
MSEQAIIAIENIPDLKFKEKNWFDILEAIIIEMKYHLVIVERNIAQAVDIKNVCESIGVVFSKE